MSLQLDQIFRAILGENSLMDNPFEWMRDLSEKPVASCRACRGAYFPHLRWHNCLHISLEEFESMAAAQVRNQIYWAGYYDGLLVGARNQVRRTELQESSDEGSLQRSE